MQKKNCNIILRKTYIVRLLLVLFLICIIHSETISQSNETYLYNTKEQLRVDTTLCLSGKYLQTFGKIEGQIISLISGEIQYPQLARELNVSGLIIAAIDYDSLDFKEIRYIRNDIPGIGFEDSINIVLKRVGKIIVTKIGKLENSQKGGTFYIPFDFILYNYKDNIITRKRQAIPIIAQQILISIDQR